MVVTPPADEPLQTYQVRVEDGKIIVSEAGE
jgi:nitrite reductase/ring-hydroxylating ferredoxin subunit